MPTRSEIFFAGPSALSRIVPPAVERAPVHEVSGGNIVALFRGRFSAQRRVAMRLPSEKRNHVSAATGLRRGELVYPAQMGRRLTGQCLGQLDASLDQVKLLRMAEREHEEGLLPNRGQTVVEPAFESVEGQGHRLRILGIGGGGPAMEAARELIEDDDQGEAGPRCACPGIERATRGCRENIGMALGDQRIGAATEPELELPAMRILIGIEARRKPEC